MCQNDWAGITSQGSAVIGSFLEVSLPGWGCGYQSHYLSSEIRNVHWMLEDVRVYLPVRLVYVLTHLQFTAAYKVSRAFSWQEKVGLGI